MIEKLDVTNVRGVVLSLMMEDNDGPYQVDTIDGLDPVKATFSSSSNAASDGESFQSAKLPARNIVIKLDLDPDFDPKGFTELRQDLYKWFMPKANLTLRFYETTGLYLDIEAMVEEISSPLFVNDPNVTISLMCFQPDFIDPRMVTIEGGSVPDGTNTEIDYPGSVEAGTVITIDFNRPVSDFTIYNTDAGGRLSQLDFTYDILDDDQLVISSLRGNKGITLTRGGISQSVLYGRSPQSSWISFAEGVNLFRVYAVGDPLPYTLEYVVRYGGL